MVQEGWDDKVIILTQQISSEQFGNCFQEAKTLIMLQTKRILFLKIKFSTNLGSFILLKPFTNSLSFLFFNTYEDEKTQIEPKVFPRLFLFNLSKTWE